jgi:prevent-host-death family protein
MNKWQSAEAKQKFSHVIDESAREPQVIYRREKPVSVIIGYTDFEKDGFEAEKKTTRMWLEELKELNRLEGDFTPPDRTDRRQPDWDE